MKPKHRVLDQGKASSSVEVGLVEVELVPEGLPVERYAPPPFPLQLLPPLPRMATHLPICRHRPVVLTSGMSHEGKLRRPSGPVPLCESVIVVTCSMPERI